MNNRYLKRIYNLFLHPKQEWQSINLNQEKKLIPLYWYLLPVIILNAILRGFRIYDSLSAYFADAIITGVTYLITAFLSVYVIIKLIHGIINNQFGEISRYTNFILISYSMLPLLMFNLMTQIHDQLYFLNIMGLYSLVLLYHGLSELTQIKKEKLPGLVIICGFISAAVVLVLQFLISSIIMGIVR